jgi:hypothetical protein
MRRLACAALLLIAAEPPANDAAFFENEVRPVLVRACLSCHGPAKQRSSLRLDSRDAMLTGGDGGPAVVPGKPADSPLVSAVAHRGPLKMPPDKKLTDREVAVLTRWVEAGAPWPGSATGAKVRSGGVTDADRQFWSFRPVTDPPVPAVRDIAWPRTDIDRFLLAKLEAAGLAPAPSADRATLLRRVTFDLTGLPPTPEELDAFLADTGPDAYERVVERLLASPAYGERWGRHWLDVVRYADTAGETADYPAPLAYRYRDWVVNAFNRDQPYDEFLREQVAGDILAAAGPRNRYAERVVATGFVAVSRRFGFDPENYQHLTIQDTIDTVGQAVLGLTLGCARCHDHKFDPVTRHDYYALYGIFAGTKYAFPGSEQKRRPYDLVPLVPPAEAKQSHELAYAVTEGKPGDARLHRRGEPRDLGESVPRRFLEVLGGDRLPPGTAGSGRRELADWLTRPSNPLTARVMVNRVWQHHFGTGLVATPNDFGARGRPPSHPELLDHLAARFVAGGWSVKALHRRILHSAAYRTATAPPSDADPSNRLLAHFNRRRLSAEELRDALLMLGVRLDRTAGGPHPFPPPEQWKFTQHTPFSAVYPTDKRSVYLMTPRLRRHPYLALFDGPDPNASTARREPTTVPTQALFLMNDPLVHTQADGFAARLLAVTPDERGRIVFAHRAALGRPPEPDELAAAATFLAAYRTRLQSAGTPAAKVEPLAWAALARTLFGRNEFLFVE